MKANITIEKTSSTNGQELEAGSKVTYTVTLRNTSSVTGKTTVEESVPEHTTLVGDIKVATSEKGTGNPTTLSNEQVKQMADGTLELTVPGNGWVTITFTVKLENESIGTIVENTAKMGEEDTPSDKITNKVKKDLNIYEAKTELGKQSVVLVVDMTLSMGAAADSTETDRLAYAPVENGSINYEKGYQNTRWYQLKTALDEFINSYLGNNPGNKKSVAIVGFCDGVQFTTDFMTSASKAKGVYENKFTLEQYTAAVKFAEECNGDEEKFYNFFERNNHEGSYKIKYKENRNGTYDIDVDILSIIDKTDYTDQKCGLSSGTNIASGLEKGESLVSSQTNKGIITDAIIITDGDNNKGDKNSIDDCAKDIMENSVRGKDGRIYSKLYAIGFTESVTEFDKLLNGNYTEYFSATNTEALKEAFKDIINDTDISEKPIVREATVETNGYVSLDGIELSDSSKITFYTGEELTAQTTVVTYENLQALKDSGYYNASANTFNLRDFLSDYNVDAAATINMQVYTVK